MRSVKHECFRLIFGMLIFCREICTAFLLATGRRCTQLSAPSLNPFLFENQNKIHVRKTSHFFKCGRTAYYNQCGLTLSRQIVAVVQILA